MFLSDLIYHIPFWIGPVERSGDGALDYFDDTPFQNRERWRPEPPLALSRIRAVSSSPSCLMIRSLPLAVLKRGVTCS
jgi:hypothetical protein